MRFRAADSAPAVSAAVLAASAAVPAASATVSEAALPPAAPVLLGEVLGICEALLTSGPSASDPCLPPDLAFVSFDAPEWSGPGSLTFVGERTPLRVLSALKASLILASPGAVLPASLEAVPRLRVVSIHAAMAALLAALEHRIHRDRPFAPGPGNRIAASAVVEGCLEGQVTVGPGAYVGKGSYIGAGTRIEANAVIQDHCRIGRDCVIQSGAMIGCAGFGFFPRPVPAGTGAPALDLRAMPHLAGVEIGEACWIGANSVVAAGVLHPTRLGRGCKLDSHVQIAHNVRLGEDCLLASQSGIAGSTVAGDRLRMGGASSLDGHLHLGKDVAVAACSAVTKDLADGAVVAGFPARPIREWRREQIALRRAAADGEGTGA